MSPARSCRTGTKVSVTQVLGDIAAEVVGIEGNVAPGTSADVHRLVSPHKVRKRI